MAQPPNAGRGASNNPAYRERQMRAAEAGAQRRAAQTADRNRTQALAERASGSRAVTQAGGSGPPSIPPGREVAAASPEGRPPAPRGQGAVVPTPEPRTMRDVPNIRLDNSTALPAPDAPAPAAAAARGGARRLAGAALGLPGAVAVGALSPTAVADATLPPGQRYGGQAPDEAPAGQSSRNGANGARSEAVDRATDDNSPANPDSVRMAPPARGNARATPPRRARSPEGSSDTADLNARSLRAIAGEASDGSARDENIRRRMRELSGMKKGGAVAPHPQAKLSGKAKEGYAKGGAVGGRKGDGCCTKGKTKGRFI